jgi:hypothetical protein
MMESTGDRKDAIRKFKERKPTCGVYAVRSTATGAVWVGSFANLEAIRTRLWFSLRLGSHRDKALQDEYNAHGERTFQYEILEKFDDDLCPIEVSDRLKDRRHHWATQLGARVL